MELETVLGNLDGVPEAIKPAYTLKDGKYILSIKGDPPGYLPNAQAAEINGKVAEFRDSNIGLKKQVDELMAKLKAFEGVDPEEHKQLKAKAEELKGKGVKGGDDVQKLLEAAVAPLMSRIDAMAVADKENKEALARQSLEARLTSAAIKAGVDERAIRDFLARGKEVFRIEDGRVVAKKGDTPLFSRATPTAPLEPEEWAAVVAIDEAPHLFKASRGGGAAPVPGAPQSQAGTYKPIEDDGGADFLRNLKAIAGGKMKPSEQTAAQ